MDMRPSKAKEPDRWNVDFGDFPVDAVGRSAAAKI
jgi:hypothetical protein